MQICGEANVGVIREAAKAAVPRCAFISVHDYNFPGRHQLPLELLGQHVVTMGELQMFVWRTQVCLVVYLAMCSTSRKGTFCLFSLSLAEPRLKGSLTLLKPSTSNGCPSAYICHGIKARQLWLCRAFITITIIYSCSSRC